MLDRAEMREKIATGDVVDWIFQRPLRRSLGTPRAGEDDGSTFYDGKPPVAADAASPPTYVRWTVNAEGTIKRWDRVTNERKGPPEQRITTNGTRSKFGLDNVAVRQPTSPADRRRGGA
jgi:hypothetical protein